jgi:hypothetical protein
MNQATNANQTSQLVSVPLHPIVGRRFWNGKELVESAGPSADHHHLPRQPKLAWGKARCHGCGYATTEVPGKPILCGSCQQSTANE